ncbi:trypco2 family protein [Streptomyces aquilus]|uniref:Trypsin-co-occurring domain-containing protein n=1 Tax=Streptomyces aquilus TaxID=2548456 RepID=A0A3Q9BY37_9ACTN|nr:trypco2 family protein [Streptomyces aquilus]AZP17417.1 hypothetical protein EJC51_15595 [Streptomyces aquilus]
MRETGADEGMDLADAITMLREQLAEAQRRVAAHGDQGVNLTLGEITLQLGMELTHTRGIDGGLRFSALSFGGKRERADRGTHTLTLTLNAGGPDGRPLDVNDRE